MHSFYSYYTSASFSDAGRSTTHPRWFQSLRDACWSNLWQVIHVWRLIHFLLYLFFIFCFLDIYIVNYFLLLYISSSCTGDLNPGMVISVYFCYLPLLLGPYECIYVYILPHYLFVLLYLFIRFLLIVYVYETWLTYYRIIRCHYGSVLYRDKNWGHTIDLI